MTEGTVTSDGIVATDVLRLAASRQELHIGRLLGAGTQGLVYEVAMRDAGRIMALKWYRPDSASTSQFGRINRLLALGAPGRAFLWPIDLVRADNRPSFGYVMAVRDARFESLTALMNAKVTIPLEVVCRAAANLSDAFLALHANGLCYADISFGNLFVDPATGDIQICDNDNVCVDGEPSDVLGTPYFMAPEIVRGEAVPSIIADRHSLAVVLFYLLLRHHPLFGAREHALSDLTPDSLRALLGERPLFIFDPDDESNRPVSHAQDNPIVIWPALPGYVQGLFTTAFTTGLREPEVGRVTESQWRSAMRHLGDLVRSCPSCESQQFYDPAEPRTECAQPLCRAALPPPARLVTHTTVVLEAGKDICQHHFTPVRTAQADTVIGKVLRHPQTGVIALRNVSALPWLLHRPDRPDAEVDPGVAIAIRPDMSITVDGVKGRLYI
jgi:DNA-binding helix-hairpin-helix protein with protein kinase domain